MRTHVSPVYENGGYADYMCSAVWYWQSEFQAWALEHIVILVGIEMFILCEVHFCCCSWVVVEDGL